MIQAVDSGSDRGPGTTPLTSLSFLERVKFWGPGAWRCLVDVDGPLVELARVQVEDVSWWAFWRLAVDGQSRRDVTAELRLSCQAVLRAKYCVLQLLRQEVNYVTLPSGGESSVIALWYA
jgi:hypothetical protein